MIEELKEVTTTIIAIVLMALISNFTSNMFIAAAVDKGMSPVAAKCVYSTFDGCYAYLLKEQE